MSGKMQKFSIFFPQEFHKLQEVETYTQIDAALRISFIAINNKM